MTVTFLQAKGFRSTPHPGGSGLKTLGLRKCLLSLCSDFRTVDLRSCLIRTGNFVPLLEFWLNKLLTTEKLVL